MGRTERQLVLAAQRGDERAFEALYRRYHPRVAGYVLGTLKDHGRAEDITQEVFLSALRRMRTTDRPIAFEPWIFAIARNACIDEFRRAQRSHEAPGGIDEAGALAGPGPTPDAALATKLELDALRGAFGGLSDQHHEALVLRELDGLSHREIGERMGISRSAVESTLARARRRLTAEYEELATGARCRQIQGMIASAAEIAFGAREMRRLARHVAHCQPCRRQALAAGIDPAMLDVPRRRRIAGLLPIPALARFLRFGDTLSEPAHAGWAKAAAVVAVVVAGAGATGAGTDIVRDRDPGPSSSAPSAQQQRHVVASAEPVATTAATTPRERASRAAPERARLRTEGKLEARRERPSARRHAPAVGDAPQPGGAPPPASEPTRDAGSDSSGGGGGARPDEGSADDRPTSPPPAGDTPQPPRRTVSTGVTNTLAGVGETVRGATDGVGQTLDGVNQTLQGSPDGLGETVRGVNETVTGVTGGLQDATDGLDEALDGVLGGLLGPRR